MFAQVIVDVLSSQVDKIFDYIIPTEIILTVGVKVIVPFGNRNIEGYVIGITDTTQVPTDKLKPIKQVVNDYVISQELIELCHYLKNNFYLKMIDCIRLCIPTVVRKGVVKHLQLVNATLNLNQQVVTDYLKNINKNATKQLAIIQYLQNNATDTIPNLNTKFGNASVKKLLQNNVLVTTSKTLYRQPLENIKKDKNTIIPTKLQQNAINQIISLKGQTVLLHGVTGSGKTEIYLQVIQHALNQGKTAIMLVPEISLTPQMVSRFRARFGNQVAVLHSGLSDGEKFDEWVKLYQGKASVVVGARSAIFAPLKNIGVIIIDEEHDNSYNSESNPRYITSDVATFRSTFHNCPLVLGSATPQIDSYYKAKQNQYQLIELPIRVNNQQLPQVNIVDMMTEFRGGNTSAFSAELINQMQIAIAHKKQIILFINRRGYSSFLMCRDCGYVPKCEHCDVTLTYHKHDNELKCHYCGKRYKVLTTCPVCQSKNIKLGGIGTERVVSDLKQLFPAVPIFRMDNDTTTTKDAHSKILSQFEGSKPGILVGTQMIAKGHDFPNVTLVGILDADLSLYFGEFRATEKTFQLITQVAGRAGRSSDGGQVILQTYFPKHYVYKLVANYDYTRFYDKEINLREVTNYPPFSLLVRVLISSESEDVAKESTHNLFMQLKELRINNPKDFMFLEAMRSPVTKIKNKFRYQVVARIAKNTQILHQIYQICDTIKNKDIAVFVELNPQSLS